MRSQFTAVIERDGEWFVAWSPEIPGANGQGRSVEECRESLGFAIQLILEDRREEFAVDRWGNTQTVERRAPAPHKRDRNHTHKRC